MQHVHGLGLGLTTCVSRCVYACDTAAGRYLYLYNNQISEIGAGVLPDGVT